MAQCKFFQLLNSMPYRMTKIQPGPDPLFRGILFYHVFLNLTASGHHIKKRIVFPVRNLLPMLCQPLIISVVLDQSMLDDLSHSGSELSLRETL